jgi:uncharacterized protein (UPF0261 family)
MVKTVLLIGTLDTKDREFEFLKKSLKRNNVNVIVMDAGIFGKPYFQAEISREKVAETGGKSLNEFVKSNDRGKSLEIMMKGVKEIAK